MLATVSRPLYVPICSSRIASQLAKKFTRPIPNGRIVGHHSKSANVENRFSFLSTSGHTCHPSSLCFPHVGDNFPVSSISGLPGMFPGGTCFSCCCPSVNFNFFKTTEGMIKLLQVVLGIICQNLLVNYGVTYSVSLGTFYYSFLTTVSAGAFTSLILLLCYVVSPRTFQLEPLFNGILSFLYLSSSCYFAFAVYTFLFPIYKILSIFQGYPAMNAIYITGFALGGIHGYDSWRAYKRYS